MIPLLRYLFAPLGLAATLLLVACTMMASNEDPSIGGTGSEVVGVVEYPDSGATAKLRAGGRGALLPLIDGSVFINPRTYLADTSHGGEAPKAKTQPDGSFCIANVLPGEHMLYVRDGGGNGVAITFTAPSEPRRIDLGTLLAKKTAGVSIQYNGNVPGDVLFFIDVRGTGMQLRCTSSNLAVTLGNIPTGVNQIITVRMFKPVLKGYDLDPINLAPGVVATLQAITGD
jgi:hypothetical protein